MAGTGTRLAWVPIEALRDLVEMAREALDDSLDSSGLQPRLQDQMRDELETKIAALGVPELRTD